MTAIAMRSGIVAELRHARLSPRHADKAADAILRRRWGSRAKSYAAYLADARHRQAGGGFVHPLLRVTDEELARADADIAWRLDPRARAAAKAAREVEFGPAPFRLTGHGLERLSFKGSRSD